MSLLRKRPAQPPPRDPHPDPRTEAQLQRVLSAQAAIERKKQAADAAMRDATRAATESGRVTHHDIVYCNAYAQQASSLRQVAAALEEEITELHDVIEKILASLGDDALFLAAPARRAEWSTS